MNYTIDRTGKAICDGVKEELKPGVGHIWLKDSKKSIINKGKEDLVMPTIVVKPIYYAGWRELFVFWHKMLFIIETAFITIGIQVSCNEGEIIMSKVILITGASSGMGRLSAKNLIEAGHRVYCLARSVDKMQDLAEIGGQVRKMDVTNEDDIENVVKEIILKEGKIDVLWNNAGYGLYGPVEEIPMEKVQMQFEVNVYGVARLTKKVLPYMREKRNGLIINTSSMGGKIYTPLGAWYHASKHAIEGYSDCLRMEVQEFGINVVILEPGMIETGFNQGVRDNFSFESQTGPYKRVVNAYIKAMDNPPVKGSDPKVILDVIIKIINAKKPKTRYVVGRGGKLLISLRGLFGDRFYDRMMHSQFK